MLKIRLEATKIARLYREGSFKMASGKRAGHVAPPRRKPVARPAAVHEADDDDDDGPEEHGFGDDDDDNDDDDEEDEVDDQEAQLDAQLRALQDELASVPFEQLAQMKQRMSMLQKQKKARAAVVAAAREAREQEGPKSKHRPVEMSSKKRVPYLRQVVENTAKVRSLRSRCFFFLNHCRFFFKQHSRDPRFDAVVGKLNKEQFGNAYSFLDSYRSSEINMLQKQLKTEKDEQRRMDVQRVLTKMVK